MIGHAWEEGSDDEGDYFEFGTANGAVSLSYVDNTDLDDDEALPGSGRCFAQLALFF